MRRAILAACGLWCALAVAPVQAESLAECRALAQDAARLACYDALEGAAQPGAVAQLTTMLGDPEAVGKNYDILGNAETVWALLPGRWLIAPWKLTQNVLDEETFKKACELNPSVIAPKEGQAYALSVNRENPKRGSFHVQDILLSTHSRFAHATDIDGMLAYLNMDPEKYGLAPVNFLFAQAVSEWTYLPLSDDVLLLVNSAEGADAVMLRCPEAG